MNTNDWFKPKGYIHITPKIGYEARQEVYNYVSIPSKVARHKFKPLIHKTLKSRRYKIRSEDGRKSHKNYDSGVLTSNTKARPIHYATHIDTMIYSYYNKRHIAPAYEKKLKSYKSLSECITAYRRIPSIRKNSYKNNIHFAKDVFDEISNRGECIAIAVDVKSFFSSLNHKHLKRSWYQLLGKQSLPSDHYNIFKSITNFSYINDKDLREPHGGYNEKKIAHNRKMGVDSFFLNFKELLDSNITIFKNQVKDELGNLKGIPQGLSVSATLANLYLYEFDKKMYDILVESKGCFYRRYSDDIIVVCNKEQFPEIEPFIKKNLELYHLEISQSKTEITEFSNFQNRLQCYNLTNGNRQFNVPLVYLGFEYYGYQTLIKNSSLASFYRRMKRSIRIKNKRVESEKLHKLVDSGALYKRKIYRLYSYKGTKSRTIRTYTHDSKNNRVLHQRKYRGNFIKYVYNSSDIMNAPEIKRQLRKHWKILQKTISKYD